MNSWKNRLSRAKTTKTRQLDIAGFWHEETKRFLTYPELLKLPREEVVDWKGKPRGWRVVQKDEYEKYAEKFQTALHKEIDKQIEKFDRTLAGHFNQPTPLE